MKLQSMTALAMSLLATPLWAVDGQLGLFFGTFAQQCAMNVPCNCRGTLYVYAILQGASATGLSGAEYKIATGSTAADPGWFFSETFVPGALVLGSGALNPADPFTRGVNIAWPDCQHGDGFKVLIETVAVLRADCEPGTMPQLVVQGVKHDQASNQFFQCPLFTLCDAPTFTKVCLGSNRQTCRNPEPPFPNNATCSTSGQAFLNPACCVDECSMVEADCTIAAAPMSWSRVKALYGR